jgi:hypothetical protein
VEDSSGTVLTVDVNYLFSYPTIVMVNTGTFTIKSLIEGGPSSYMSVGQFLVTCYDIDPTMTGSFSITQSNNVLTFSTNTVYS